jgi:TonB family protein
MKKTNASKTFVLLFACVLAAASFISCDRDDDDDIPKETYLVEIDGQFQESPLDEVPEYIDGGEDGLYNAALQVVSYPAEAREQGIEGTVCLSYEITVQGTVENIEIVEGVGGGISESAIAALEEVTEGVSFTPGILNGIPVRVKMEIKITYRLN